MPQDCLRKGLVPDNHQSLVQVVLRPHRCRGLRGFFFGGTDTEWNGGQAFRHVMLFRRFLGSNLGQLCQILRDFEEQ